MWANSAYTISLMMINDAIPFTSHHINNKKKPFQIHNTHTIEKYRFYRRERKKSSN